MPELMKIRLLTSIASADDSLDGATDDEIEVPALVGEALIESGQAEKIEVEPKKGRTPKKAAEPKKIEKTEEDSVHGEA